MTYFVCRKEDEYTQECQTDRGLALWKAELSNGEAVYMDDGRPGVEPYSAWVRLADYVGQTGHRIIAISLVFRDSEKTNILPANAEGYFFCKSILGTFNSTRSLSFYLLGALQDGKLKVQKWLVPELILVEESERELDSGPCFIRNPSRGTQLAS